MKTFKSNFKVLSRTDMQHIFGGLLPGSATADCGNGRFVRCQGDSCVAFDASHPDPALSGHCNCWTDVGGPEGTSDTKQCEDL